MSLPWTSYSTSLSTSHSAGRATRLAVCRQHSVQRSVHRSTLSAHVVPTATTRFGDDDLLLLLLVSTWELQTARPAPAIPLVEMTEQELLEYWSDPADEPGPLPYRPTGRTDLSPTAAASCPASKNTTTGTASAGRDAGALA
ncbi:hypothetical protein GCM10009727_89120 [Actinomadura napierensis]|uniref:Uncharacterized protein n=1 Tax=Actinomadura napierensis TaxID=267854 RepID=A0ABN3AHY9_9ACTN